MRKNIAITNRKEWNPILYEVSAVYFKGQLEKVKEK